MFCDEALDAIEAIAAGELAPQGRVAQHLDSCKNCAAALDSARRLDKMLHARPIPKPPQQFTSRTMARYAVRGGAESSSWTLASTWRWASSPSALSARCCC